MALLRTRRKWMTSQHQNARGEKEENKKSSIFLCSILKNLVKTGHRQGLKKTKYWTCRNLSLAAVQCNGIAACAYSLNIYLQYIYSTWSVVLRPLLPFFLTNGPHMILLFRVDWSKTSFLFLLENWPISCLVWWCECAFRRMLCACVDSLFVLGFFDIVGRQPQ